MAWQRFGDVEYRVLKELEPPRSRWLLRVRYWALVGAATLIVARGLAAGASELTKSSSSKANAASAAQERARSRHPTGVLRSWHNAPHMHYGAAGIPTGRQRLAPDVRWRQEDRRAARCARP